MNRREFILAAGAFSLAPSMAATDSASLWGDIGFVAVRDKGDRAEFKLHQRDCFFPSPDIKREKSWDLIREENDGKTIKILYR